MVKPVEVSGARPTDNPPHAPITNHLPAASGASVLLVMYNQDQLFYMAAADSRLADSRALDIPSLLIGVTGTNWILQRFTEGVELSIGVNTRCSGEQLLTAASGFFESTPSGMSYCSWQVGRRCCYMPCHVDTRRYRQ